MNAPPPTVAPRLDEGQAARTVELVRVVFHPIEGESWAIAYNSMASGQKLAFILSGGEGRAPGPGYRMLTWQEGRVDGEAATFARAFSEELQGAGLSTPASSLFEREGGGDIKVAVLIDDLRGRFCMDCPNALNKNGVPATVMMAAHWEIYSNLDRKVIARINTSGGANHMARVRDSVIPAVLDAFRENTRQLIASPEFRRAVSTTLAAPGPSGQAQSAEQIAFRPGEGLATLAQASGSVAVIYAADGSGSGFLISPDGYVLTNQHVVGASKFVKLKWLDGSEVLGEVVRSDARRDVALIKTDGKGRPALVLRGGAVDLGESVFAIGTPLDDKLQNTLTKGIVSANRVYDGLPFIQSDVAVTHGNSGGPLLDDKARVIGLTVSGRSVSDAPIGLNFFIPIDDALRSIAVQPTALATAPAVTSRK